MSGLPYTNAALKWLQHGATERRELLTKRGGSHPGSADEAADNPEQERCPAACSQGHHHPLPPGQQYSKSSLRSCSPLLRGVLESSWSVLRCKRKPSSSCFLSSPLTPSRFQFWAGSSRGGAALLSPLCGSGLLLCEPVKCQGKKFKPRRNRRGEREEETDTYPALFSEIKKKNHQRTRGGNLESTEPAGENRRAMCPTMLLLPLRARASVATVLCDSEGFPVGCQFPGWDQGCAERSTAPGARLASARRGTEKHL